MSSNRLSDAGLINRDAVKGMALVLVPGLAFAAALAIGLSWWFSPAHPFEPTQFFGCYAANGLKVEIGPNFIRLPGSEAPLPAHVDRDKHGYLVVVERPVLFRRNTAGGLDLVSYRGSGTFLRLREASHPSIELVMESDDPWPILTKTACS